jgi:translocation and assembly module TamB
VALVLTFLLAFLVGVLLHLPLPPSRRVATRLVMEQVSHAIRGSIEIETISRLHLQGIEAKGVTIRDPDGEPILHAPVLRARASLIGIGMSLLPWSDGIRVPVSWVHVEHIDVVFREDLVGELTLGTTFLPPPEPVVTPAKPSKPSLPVVVDLRGIEINSVQAKGQLGGLSPVDWRARSLRGTVYVGPDGVRIDTTSFPLAFHRILQEPIQTTVDYHFRSPELMWTSVLARYRDITLSGRVQLKGEDMMIDVDLPRTDGRSFDPFLPEAVRLEDEVEGKIVAHGPIPVLQTHVRLASDKTTVDGIGTVTLAPQFRTDIDVDIRRLDLSRIVVDGPKSNLDADLMVRARVDSKGRGRVRLTGDVSPTVLFDVPLPGADVEALIDSDGVSGVAHIHEFGMPVRADFTVSETGKVRVTAVTNVPSLIVVPRLQRAIGGYAVAKLEGTWDQGQLDAKVSTQGGNLVRDGVRLGAANVELHLWGPPEGLRMDARVRGTRLDLGGAKWNGVEASLQGPVKTPQLRMRLSDDAFPDVNVVAGLDVRDRLAARDVDVTIDQGQERVAVRTDMLELRDGVVDLGALAIDGLGEPIDAMARIASTGFDVRVVSDGIDLDRLSRIVPLPGPRVTGIVGIDVDLRNVGDETSGCARFDMQDGKVHTLFPISAIDLSVRALFTGRHVELDTNVSMGGQGKAAPPPSDRVGLCLPARPVREGGIAKARATASLTLGGPPAQVSSWEGLMGTARLVDATVDLNRVQTMITPMTALQSVVAGGDSLGLGGTIRLNGDFVRDRPDAPPTWMLAASTTNLDIQLPTTGMVNRVKGADLFATVAMDRGGLLRGSMCVSSQSGPYVADTCNPARAEVLANLSLMAELDYQQLFETPKLWKQVLVEAKVDSRLVVHDRPASALLRPLQLEGALPVDADRASATVAWRGTVLAPHVDYRLQLVGIGTRDLAWRTPTSICGQGQYDGRQAWLHADLRRSREGLGTDAICSLSPGGAVSSLGTVDADLTVGWKDVISWWSEPMISWEANVKAMIHSFELSDIPAFGDNGVSGRARLAGTVKGLGKKPEVDVQLGLEDLRTGPTVDYDQSHIRVRADASGLQGSLAFIDVDEKGETTSSLTLAVDTEQVRWEGGWYPAKDGSKPVKIALESKRFKLGMLTPLVQPVFSYVEGELTGKAEGTWSPAEGKSRIDEMYFFVDNGAFQVPAIGQEFLQVKGALQAANSERIFVEPFRAQSLTGSLEGRATIDLRDLDIEHVEASIWTPDRDKIRLTFAGIPVGDLAGNVNVSIDPGKEQHDVKVVFDGVRVDLPRTDMRSVQQLDDNPDIEVYPPLQSVDDRSTGGKVTPWVVVLETKNPIVLQRFDMNFRVVTSKSALERTVLVYPDPKTGEATLTGHVIMYDGRIDVVGNRFEMEENARVIFDGDPGDPKLNVTARWDSPDGTRVFADVTGPLRDPRIQFRSEPAMPQAEILALILFGPQTQGSGTTTAGAEGDSSGATDVGGGVASAGINMLLQDLSPGVSTRIDTSRGQSPSPTVVVQVSQNVTAEATYISEEATLDKSDRYLVTFDWRFMRQWSLRITRGNVGTSILDVIWQHRY